MSFKYWNFLILICILSVQCRNGKPKKKCGLEVQHRGFVVPKIYNGTIVKTQMTWPWMVSIGYDNSTGYHHLCGGALIDNKHVLSASHCFDSELDQGTLSLVLGTLDYTSHTGYRIDRSIKKVHIHPKYNNDHAYYDVAIIEMDLTVELNNFVYPICVPETAGDVDNRMNTGGSLAGWGVTEESNGEASNILRETKMNVFAQAHCNNSWDISSAALSAGASYVQKELPELFQSSLLCAGSGGSGKACGGDSGSPLMVFDTSTTPPTWVHIGIVHGGVICSDFFKNLDFPEIFSRTEDSEVLDFIRGIMYDYDYDDYEDYDDYYEYYDHSICKTISGSKSNQECKFPFTFRGIEHNTCISGSKRRQPWCATDLDENGAYKKGMWGYCDTSNCPLEYPPTLSSTTTIQLVQQPVSKIDCQWSQWIIVGECSKSCGIGTQILQRTVQVRAQNGGRACVGESTKTENCNYHPCLVPVDCQWSSWSTWSPCSKSCGNGQKAKTRIVLRTSTNGGKDCVGDSEITQQCQTRQCPEDIIDCKWANWVKSGKCSKSCGGGTQTWERTQLIKSKNGGQPCLGESTYTDICNTDSCPNQEVNCQWSDWSTWSQCSVTCGSGTKTKRRTKLITALNGGLDCTGAKTYSSTCSGIYQCQSNSRYPSTSNTRYSSRSNTGSTSRRCRNQSSLSAKLLCENISGGTVEAFARDPIGASVDSVFKIFGK